MFPFPGESCYCDAAAALIFSILLCLHIYLSLLTEFRVSKQMYFSLCHSCWLSINNHYHASRQASWGDSMNLHYLFSFKIMLSDVKVLLLYSRLLIYYTCIIVMEYHWLYVLCYLLLCDTTNVFLPGKRRLLILVVCIFFVVTIYWLEVHIRCLLARSLFLTSYPTWLENVWIYHR